MHLRATGAGASPAPDERTTGRFQYSVWLPGDVDDEHVDAALDAGVLRLRLPKPERDRPRKITLG